MVRRKEFVSWCATWRYLGAAMMAIQVACPHALGAPVTEANLHHAQHKPIAALRTAAAHKISVRRQVTRATEAPEPTEAAVQLPPPEVDTSDGAPTPLAFHVGRAIVAPEPDLDAGGSSRPGHKRHENASAEPAFDIPLLPTTPPSLSDQESEASQMAALKATGPSSWSTKRSAKSSCSKMASRFCRSGADRRKHRRSDAENRTEREIRHPERTEYQDHARRPIYRGTRVMTRKLADRCSTFTKSAAKTGVSPSTRSIWEFPPSIGTRGSCRPVKRTSTSLLDVSTSHRDAPPPAA